MNKLDLALNNQQLLICYKTKPNQTKPYLNKIGDSTVYNKNNKKKYM